MSTSISPPSSPWARSIEDLAASLDTSPSEGLPAGEASRRLSRFGENRIRTADRESPLVILLRQFKSIIMVVLAVAAAASFVLGEVVDGAAVIVAILINAGIGFVTELRALRSMEALQDLDVKYCRIMRDGSLAEYPAQQVVPGDLIDLSAGDVVPADIRITESNGLQVDESALTGESVPVRKTPDAVAENTPVAERAGMVFKGTAVTEGSGFGLAVATGMDTEIGAVSSMVEQAESGQDPLDKRLDSLGGTLVRFIIAVAALTGVVGVLAGQEVAFMVKTAIALFVAAVPEGLPIVATLALARGMHRMAKRNALIRRLSAVETLGSTTVILTDKTGTLTENRMTASLLRVPAPGESEPDLSDVDPAGEEVMGPARAALEVAVLCNNAQLAAEDEATPPGDLQQADTQEADSQEPADVGDPMEVALLAAGRKAGISRDALLESQPEVREVAFDADLKMMATYHHTDRGLRLAVKGAPEAVLPACGAFGGSDLSDDLRNRVLEDAERLAAGGYRVLALAERYPDDGPGDARSVEDDEPYRDLSFLALIALADPPRGDVPDAVAECAEAGVRVVMVTGDQAATAAAIGREVGICSDASEVRLGRELSGGPESREPQDRQALLDCPVFARVSPEQKLSLIRLHQEAGDIVAMTGDGVNDAPALKQANIGVAMGRRGEPVAEDAADIILQDDRFATIPVAIRYGRIIFRNIRRFVMYMISGNVGEILVVLVAALAGMPLPLLPLQILYINAINDIFPALALGVGPGSAEVMKRPPRDPAEPIMARRHWIALVAYGLTIAVSVFGAFLLALGPLGFSEEAAVTISFLTVAFSRLLHVFNMRSASSGLFRNDVVANGFVWGALALCTGLLLLAVYLPPVAAVLGVVTPGASGWLVIVGASLTPLVVGQIAKAALGRRGRKTPRGTAS